MSDKKLIQSILRGLDILEFIARHGNSCRLQDISEGLGLNKSTAHSLISTLEHRGYIQQCSTSPRYMLGLNCMRLGIIYRRDFFAREQMNKLLHAFSAAVGETCYFVVRVGRQFFYLDAAAPDRSLKADTKIGEFVDLDKPTAIAKAFLSGEAGEGAAGTGAAGTGAAGTYETEFEEYESGINSMAMAAYKQRVLMGVIAVCGPAGRFAQPQMDAAYATLCGLLRTFEVDLTV